MDTDEDHGATDTNSSTSRATSFSKGSQNALQADTDGTTSWPTMSTESQNSIHTSCTNGNMDIAPEAMSENQATHGTNRHTVSREGTMDLAVEPLSQNEADMNVVGSGRMTHLMKAAADGNLAGVISLLYSGGNVSLTDADGNNTLHYACIGGNIDVVKRVLIQDIVDINKRGKWGRTPIMLAAKEGHKQIFHLLKEKCDLTLVSNHGDNLLHLACLGGSIAITRYILSKGIADINGRGRYGRTPLMKAAWGGNVEVFKEISRRGGDESLLDDHGSNVLHIACHRDNVAMVKYLISENIAGINSRGKMGRTPVMLAAANGQKKVFRLLVDEGVDLLLQDDNDENILHMACLGGNEDILKYMIFGTMKNILSKGNISVHSRGMKKRTPLMAAAEGGHIGAFDLLVKKGANLSTQDKLGNNIFHAACLGGNENMVKYIMSHGFVNTDCNPKNDRLALMLAAERKHRQVFDYLRQIQTPDFIHVDKDFNNILHVACIGGDVTIVKFLLSRDMDINIRGNRNRTPLMFAAEHGHKDIFELLVVEGADVSLEDDAGNTILHVACLGGHLEMVKYIFSRDYIRNYVETKGERGQTPVMLAAKSGHKSVFYLLVCKGASLSVKDYDGNNIFQVACIGGHVKMVECLLSNDIVDINELRQDGKSALMLAVECGHKDVIDLLQHSGAE
ncbi:serine/threonine-protein phosphatase 6 regulatory ankyrin repeat subunit A-like [Haliotis asinina]|uniref:serine/threonine-protein phosphatase 6 regulatory ankyrin repeat subunit A-like n=1 Tax=Haliotis asinina TaxID=109174 RepID=UPI003532166E